MYFYFYSYTRSRRKYSSAPIIDHTFWTRKRLLLISTNYLRSSFFWGFIFGPDCGQLWGHHCNSRSFTDVPYKKFEVLLNELEIE